MSEYFYIRKYSETCTIMSQNGLIYVKYVTNALDGMILKQNIPQMSLMSM